MKIIPYRPLFFQWHKKFKVQKFKKEREYVKNGPHSERPSANRTVVGVRRSSFTSDLKSTGYEKKYVWKIITEDLGIRKVCAKIVLRLVNDESEEAPYACVPGHHRASSN